MKLLSDSLLEQYEEEIDTFCWPFDKRNKKIPYIWLLSMYENIEINMIEIELSFIWVKFFK